ncbi:Tn3 family transposase [Nonomuraea fuscirosea]|uniref:Tn3 family transposase n=1 Tax=Nonomuraea fuscirosea TaxID=1291556 RepID=UPI0033E06319
MVEAWNRANSVLCYGRGGEISTNRRDEVEMAALCLRILQASLVMVNVLMLQDVLAEPEWAALLTPIDRRGLTPAVLAARPPLRRGASRPERPVEHRFSQLVRWRMTDMAC